MLDSAKDLFKGKVDLGVEVFVEHGWVGFVIEYKINASALHCWGSVFLSGEVSFLFAKAPAPAFHQQAWGTRWGVPAMLP